MYILAAFPKEVYDLGVAGILCLVIWGLTRAFTEWLKIRSGETSTVKLQVLADIAAKLNMVSERLPRYGGQLDLIQSEVKALYDVHCGDQAYVNGRPRWFISDDLVEKVSRVYELLVSYDQLLVLAKRHCKDCDGSDPDHLCVVAQMLGVLEDVDPSASNETKRYPSGRSKRR